MKILKTVRMQLQNVHSWILTPDLSKVLQFSLRSLIFFTPIFYAENGFTDCKQKESVLSGISLPLSSEPNEAAAAPLDHLRKIKRIATLFNQKCLPLEGHQVLFASSDSISPSDSVTSDSTSEKAQELVASSHESPPKEEDTVNSSDRLVVSHHPIDQEFIPKLNHPSHMAHLEIELPPDSIITAWETTSNQESQRFGWHGEDQRNKIPLTTQPEQNHKISSVDPKIPQAALTAEQERTPAELAAEPKVAQAVLPDDPESDENLLADACEEDECLSSLEPIAVKRSSGGFFAPFYFNLSLAYNTGKSVECHQGYSTVSLFCTPYTVNCIQPFADARYHVLNNGEQACNFGIGGRYENSPLGKIFGFNLYYDYLHFKKDYHQIGVGFEILGCECDLRVNGYIPLRNQSRSKFREAFDYPYGFRAEHYNREKQMGGVDAEIATSFNKFYGCEPCEWDPFIAAGGYYFRGVGKRHYRGGKIRAGINYIDLLSFEVRASYDNINHGLVEGVFTLSLPFYTSGSCCSDSCTPCIWPLILQPVQRNEIIATDRDCFWRTNYEPPCLY